MRTYKWDDLRELYRVDNKYWKTGDVDILDKRCALGKRIDDKFWSEILSLTALTTRRHLPFNVLVDALKLYGYVVEEQQEESREAVND